MHFGQEANKISSAEIDDAYPHPRRVNYVTQLKKRKQRPSTSEMRSEQANMGSGASETRLQAYNNSSPGQRARTPRFL
ncbi:hypothetical protein IGI04_024472 [Brassica rapa subsp. trilocularis]|uniref:DUF4005 domain-containing protein n=1 Tax=Brassica rapa subsp. trilocularis TaxID=1813537 RepID=A0ABQ7M6T6_BRACM|nr:hypothetical protein IGI04_024472 [Brassica rapa subsp. trilocularis]